MAEAYIVAAGRTAGGRKGGKLKDWHPTDLAAVVLNDLVDRTSIDPAAVEDVVMGCVMQVGEQSTNVARNAVLASKLPESVPATSVDRQCGSSQQALQFAAQAVMSGTMDVVIAAGVESMSRVPMGLSVSLPAQNGFGVPKSPWQEERYPGIQFSQFMGAEMVAEKYNLTWSVDGLINEYCRPCEAIRDRQIVELLPLEGLEHFSLDGVEYEAFNTSGGLGTLCDSLAGRVKHLDYKSVRYPGHRHLMKILLEELQLQSDQDALKRMMRKAIPTTMQDVVLVFVTASGHKNGVFVQEVFARKIFADRDAHAPKSAIQITTAAGVCAVVDLFCSGALPQQGFLRQEQVSLPDFLANRFGQVYQQWRQIESIS